MGTSEGRREDTLMTEDSKTRQVGTQAGTAMNGVRAGLTRPQGGTPPAQITRGGLAGAEPTEEELTLKKAGEQRGREKERDDEWRSRASASSP